MMKTILNPKFILAALLTGGGMASAQTPVAPKPTSPALAAAPSAAPAPLSAVDRFDYIASAQHMGSQNQIDYDPAEGSLVEGARQILAMGTSVIKITMGPSFAKHGYMPPKQPVPKVASLTELAKVPSYQQVFAMPFAHYLMWTNAFSTNGKITPFHGHMKREVLADEYKEIYDLTAYFLTTYSGTGKTFYLGNWEGDWGLLSGAPVKPHKWEEDVNPDAPQGMIDYMSIRQRAIDDAKAHTPHHDVQVYFYIECNLVQKSVKEKKLSVAQNVLPFVNPDFVSYSSYDSTNPDKDMHHDLPVALDYMQSKLKPKPGLPEKRVFIGEYTSLADRQSAAEQDLHMRDIIATGIQWGTPFVLYWELYNNVMNPDGKPQGCWLIDLHGVKQPVYYTYAAYDKDARAYVAATLKRTGHVPTTEEFHKFAYQWFAAPVKEKANATGSM